MNSRFIQYLLIFWVMVGLSACLDHRNQPITQRIRLKQIVRETTQSYASYLLNYDGNNKITSYIIHSGFDKNAENAEGPITTLQYDAQSRLSEATTKPLLKFGNGDKRTYEYDSKGNLTTIKYYSARMPGNDYVLAFVYHLEFDANKLPIKIIAERYLETGEKSLSVTSLYTYDDMNVIKREAIYPTPTNTLTETYQHDTNTNPYFGLGPVLGTGDLTVNPAYFSMNNLFNGLINLEYDKNGLLIKQSVGDKGNPRFLTVITYEYEAY